jgi:hypothetical protein
MFWVASRGDMKPHPQDAFQPLRVSTTCRSEWPAAAAITLISCHETLATFHLLSEVQEYRYAVLRIAVQLLHSHTLRSGWRLRKKTSSRIWGELGHCSNSTSRGSLNIMRLPQSHCISEVSISVSASGAKRRACSGRERPETHPAFS